MDCRPDIYELISRCIGCGECVDVCTSHRHGGCNPLEVMRGDFSKAAGCIGCGYCNDACQFTIPKKVMMHAACMAGGLDVTEAYRSTGYNLPPADRSGIPDPGYAESADSMLMPGCLANAFAPHLEYAAVKALGIAGVSVERYEGGCCTYPVTFRRLTDGERDAMKRRASASLNGRRLYTLCPGCNDEMGRSGCDSEHIFRILHDSLDVMRGLPGIGLNVAVQPGCGLKASAREFREIAEACGCTVADVAQGCCGKAVPGVSGKVMSERQSEMDGLDAVIVGCPSCFVRYDSWDGGIPVLHVAELACLASGDRSILEHHKLPLKC